MRRLRSAAVWLALIALVLRAVVPVGWMSSTAAADPATLVPCPMMDGVRGMAMPQQAAEPQRPPKHKLPPSHEGSICPFGTTARAVRALGPQRIEVAFPTVVVVAPAARFRDAAWDHAPRAPPRVV